MEILKIVINSVHEFYANVEKHTVTVEELLKKSVKPCNSITNQCVILASALKKDNWEGTGLEKLPRFKELLVNSVLNSVNKEFEQLLIIRDELETLGNDLLKKYTLLEQSFKKLQENKLVNSPLLNPASPRLEHVLDWSLDIWRYYHSLTLQISIALENVSFEDEDSVSTLSVAFKEDKRLKEEVNRIRRFELHSFPFIE